MPDKGCSGLVTRARRALLLADDGAAGIELLDPLAYVPLGRFVGRRDRRSVRLGFDFEVRPSKPLQSDIAARAGNVDCGREQLGIGVGGVGGHATGAWHSPYALFRSADICILASQFSVGCDYRANWCVSPLNGFGSDSAYARLVRVASRIWLSLMVVSIVLSGCSSRLPMTSVFVGASASALAAAPRGALIYGEQGTGSVWQMANGGAPQLLATVQGVTSTDRSDVSTVGLAASGDRIFATHMVGGFPRVSQISPGPIRTVWLSPIEAVASGLAPTPSGRLALIVTNPGVGNRPGDIQTVDPDGPTDQRPNSVSDIWPEPRAFDLDNQGYFWVADGGLDDVGGSGEPARLARASSSAPLADAVDLGKGAQPAGLARFGTQELVLCTRSDGILRRYLVQDGIRAIPGRIVAKGCTGPVTELDDGRIAYATNDAVRVTAQ